MNLGSPSGGRGARRVPGFADYNWLVAGITKTPLVEFI